MISEQPCGSGALEEGGPTFWETTCGNKYRLHKPTHCGYDGCTMTSIKAVVKNGRLLVNEPTKLEDGTVIELYEAYPPDMDPSELARLDAALERSAQQSASGEVRHASAIIDKLRASR